MSSITLGVIGGVGPLSTAYFMEAVINATDVKTDQEHIDMIVLNHTQIPDRTAFILKESQDDPVKLMVEDAQKLEQMGAKVIVTPCNTAHYFYNALQESDNVTFINMIFETAEVIKKSGIKKVGILATNGTIKTSLFQTALKNVGIEGVIPSQLMQSYVMDLIYDDVKGGKPVRMDKFAAVVDELKTKGCEAVILGCTELSVIKKEYKLDKFYVDSLEVLVYKTILACNKPVKMSFIENMC
ncbi:MAG: amino acid racemase [Oscillospiraceae bacterium]